MPDPKQQRAVFFFFFHLDVSDQSYPCFSGHTNLVDKERSQVSDTVVYSSNRGQSRRGFYINLGQKEIYLFSVDTVLVPNSIVHLYSYMRWVLKPEPAGLVNTVVVLLMLFAAADAIYC